MQQIISQAENIAQYIQMIENQVRQIQTLAGQLDEFKHYEVCSATRRPLCSIPSNRSSLTSAKRNSARR